MPVVAVVNRKGGSGKSTLATHLAAYLASRGLGVMLGNIDRQPSTTAWLRRRAALTPPVGMIIGRAVDPKNVLSAPPGVSHIVLDTPGGMQGFELARTVMFADVVLMPVCYSAFDRESAADCFAELSRHPRVASGRCKVAAVGMRIDARTKSEQKLRDWARSQGLTFVCALRESQMYVRCVERGLTIFDLPAARAQTDLDQWQPILTWLAPLLDSRYASADRAPRAPSSRPAAIEPHTKVDLTAPATPAPPPTTTRTHLRRLWGWLLPPRAASHRGRH
jgi:chromosome partitioning protein